MGDLRRRTCTVLIGGQPNEIDECTIVDAAPVLEDMGVQFIESTFMVHHPDGRVTNYVRGHRDVIDGEYEVVRDEPA